MAIGKLRCGAADSPHPLGGTKLSSVLGRRVLIAQSFVQRLRGWWVMLFGGALQRRIMLRIRDGWRVVGGIWATAEIPQIMCFYTRRGGGVFVVGACTQPSRRGR